MCASQPEKFGASVHNKRVCVSSFLDRALLLWYAVKADMTFMVGDVINGFGCARKAQQATPNEQIRDALRRCFQTYCA